ncbi:MAG: uroporphyrinogen decarboxylase [Rhodospirillaceae bacterium]|nr:uroporphyrinogen decarboxylase [Rhodospirillaceae bacterium]
MTDQSMMRVLAGEPAAVPPVWLMRQAGRYLPEYRRLRQSAASFLDLCYTPDLAAEITLQPVRRFDFDAAILFSDILVVPDGMGMTVGFEDGHGPVLVPVRNAGDLAALDPDRAAAHCAPVYEAVSAVRAALAPEKTLIGFAGGPWTVATYAVEGGSSRTFETVKAWMWRDPAGFGQLIDMLTDATVDHLSRQIDAGADCVQIFESWAGVLAEPEFRRYVVGPTRRIVEALRARHPAAPVIGLPRGAGSLIGDYVAATGVTAISLDTGVPLAQARAIQKSVPVQGNLDPLLLAAGGVALEKRIGEIVSSLAGGPHIFNLGHGIVPQTPPDHVAALVAAVRGAA